MQSHRGSQSGLAGGGPITHSVHPYPHPPTNTKGRSVSVNREEGIGPPSTPPPHHDRQQVSEQVTQAARAVAGEAAHLAANAAAVAFDRGDRSASAAATKRPNIVLRRGSYGGRFTTSAVMRGNPTHHPHAGVPGRTIMADENEVIDEPEAEAPEIEEIPLDEAKSLDEEPDEGDPDPEAEPEEELREYNFGGTKLELPRDAVPAELSEAIDKYTSELNSDYTQKSQANAEERASLAAQSESAEKIISLNGEALQTYSTGLQLRQELEALSQIDVNALWQSSPDQARRVSDQISQKQAQFQQIVTTVGQQEQALDEAQQVELVRRRDEGVAQLDREIKNFSTEVAPELIKYVVNSYGLEQSEAERWALNPSVTKMAHKAMLFDRMQAKTTSQPKPKPKQAEPVVAPKGGAKSAGSRDPNKMSMSQLSKHLGLVS